MRSQPSAQGHDATPIHFNVARCTVALTLAILSTVSMAKTVNWDLEGRAWEIDVTQGYPIWFDRGVQHGNFDFDDELPDLNPDPGIGEYLLPDDMGLHGWLNVSYGQLILKVTDSAPGMGRDTIYLSNGPEQFEISDYSGSWLSHDGLTGIKPKPSRVDVAEAWGHYTWGEADFFITRMQCTEGCPPIPEPLPSALLVAGLAALALRLGPRCRSRSAPIN